MNTVQEANTQEGMVLSERLKKAYERVSPNLRPDAVRAFCQFHRIHPDTFRKKRVGLSIVTEGECEWMEDYKPKLAIQP